MVQYWVAASSPVRLVLLFFGLSLCAFLCMYESCPNCNRPWRHIEFWDAEATTFSRQSAERWRWGYQLHASPVAFYSFPLEGESTQGQSVAGMIRPIQKSIDLIGTRTRDFPTCIIMPLVTTLQRAPCKWKVWCIDLGISWRWVELHAPAALRPGRGPRYLIG
jgi:hypothetical protein